MSMWICKRGFAIALFAFCFAVAVAPASAAEPPYEIDSLFTLTGSCSTAGSFDPLPDPGCPGGTHPGRFNRPRSVAIDKFGNEYVASYSVDGSKGRIDVFDDEGFFITTLSDPHGPKSLAVDSEGNLYAYEQTVGTSLELVRYAPTVYKPEEGQIGYDPTTRELIAADVSTPLGGIAIDSSNDHLYTTWDGGRAVREYGSAAEGNKLLATITPENLSSANWVAVDAQRRRLFVSSCNEGVLDCGVLIFEADAPYALLEEIDGSEVPLGEFRSQKGWLSIGVDELTGNFFIDDLELTDNIYEFNEDYEYIATINSTSAFAGGDALQIVISNAVGAANHRYLFVPAVVGSGWVVALSPPAECPPEVTGQVVENISETEAEVRATVNPCGGEAHYVLEYVSEAQFEAEGFAGALVAGEGTLAQGSQETEVLGLLEGLSPGVAYRYRVVAENLVDKAEVEGKFTTYADAGSVQECSNQDLRAGYSAQLPDCRAYELVTPPDTNGRPPKGVGSTGDLFTTVHSSPSGNSVSFLTEGGSLPGMGPGGAGGYNGDPYQATRGATGWSTVSTGPSGVEANVPLPGGISPDQGHLFWIAGEEGTAVVEEKEGRYIHFPDGHSELVGRGSLGTDAAAHGVLITENASHTVFYTKPPSIGASQLEPDAAPAGTQTVYDRTSDEVTHVVSLLPGDVTPAAGENAFYIGASADGEGIAFRIGTTLYLRVGNSVTYEIGDGVDFAGISEGGERIFYVEGGDLFAFYTRSEEVIPFTDIGNAVVVNVASDGSRAYFVSPSALGGENPNGAVPKAGQQNLYLSEEGEIRFVGIVTKRDVEGELNSNGVQMDGLGLWTEVMTEHQPGRDPSRSTPDGTVLLFQSRANLDGYDPEGAPQVYRFDSVAGRLHCISCIPTRTPAAGGAGLQTFYSEKFLSSPFLVAFDYVPNLRSDGKRAFFESDEALVSTDTDGVKDVYEWEEQGIGSCTKPGGCVYLISSGHSDRENYLYAISGSGDDVFFITTDVLNGFDAGNTASIYDARVNGGFPEATEEGCAGEGCRPNLPGPPALPAPESGARPQSGNVPAVRKKCPAGKRKVKRKGEVRCVKKRHHRHSSAKKGAAK